MAIVLHCACGRKLQIRDEFAGQQGQCPACGRTLAIPYGDSRDPEPLPQVRPVAVARAEDPPMPRPVPREEPPPPPPRREEEREPVVNHGGDPLPRDADFFVPAPPEIGPVVNAYSTLRVGKEPVSPPIRMIIVGVSGLGGLLLGACIDGVFGLGEDDAFWMLLWPLVGAGLGVLISWLCTRFVHTCTYVGRDGVARFVCGGNRENLTTSEVFRFREAVELRTSQVHHYNRGSYQSTTFTFTWYDVGGRKRYVITGSHTSRDSRPPSTHYFHYARAAEFAWTVYLLDDVDRQLKTSGAIHFNLTNGQWIRLGRGYMNVGIGGEPIELDAADVGAVLVDKGVVRIKRVDAEEGWFSSRGVYKFPFDSLANAQLFFHLLDKLVGVRIG